jgi:hypothetical protein
MEMKIKEQTETSYVFNVTRCRYAASVRMGSADAHLRAYEFGVQSAFASGAATMPSAITCPAEVF